MQELRTMEPAYYEKELLISMMGRKADKGRSL